MKSSRVVIVEDDAVLLTFLTNCLNANGFTVCGASNYEDALDCIISIDPDLIILDINLGVGGSGYDVSDKLSTMEDYRSIPKVFITSDMDTATKCKAFVSGAVDFMYKPINADDLLQRIKPLVSVGRLMRLSKNLEQKEVK